MSLPKNWQWSRQAINAPQEVPEWRSLKVGHIDTGIHRAAVWGDWVLWDQGLNLMEPDRPHNPTPPPGKGRSGPLDAIWPQHGTRTASVLCGHDPASGFQGVAPRLPIVPVRANDNVILNRREEQARVGQAIFHCLEKDCRVITISFGMPMIHRGGALAAAVDAAYEQGVIVCGAAGQIYGATCYPGKFFRAICVGGYKADRRGHWPVYYPYNGTGSFVDVWAPADPITRLDGNGPADVSYGTGDGTSYATPAVGAAAAYWLAHHGDAILNTYGIAPWKIVEAFRRLLKTTARDLSRGWGFHGTRLPWPTEPVPGKGDLGSDMMWVSGGLDIGALLAAPLPDIPDAAKARPALDQYM